MDKDAKLAAESFGFTTYQMAESLCPYGPVYKLTEDSRSWVLKRTGFPNSTAAGLREWLCALPDGAVEIVRPAPEFEPNPRYLPSTAADWVVYPYIAGEAYVGRNDQIEAAGQLLGNMHRAGADLGVGLRVVRTLPIHDDEWRVAEAKKAVLLIASIAPQLAEQFNLVLSCRMDAHRLAAVRLADAELPLSACSWDFKASNLVFAPDIGPVLVDPDHGGRIPRLYDLACAVLLFHCDFSTAPDRLFSKNQWATFLKGYTNQIAFIDVEYRYWRDVLAAAWMDQALWLLANWPEGWEDKRERGYLSNLAINHLDFSLGKAPQKRSSERLLPFLNEQGQLKSYPARRSQRLEALEYLSHRFSESKSYQEADVNMILKEAHTFEDWSLLRRELVDGGFLTRDSAGLSYMRASPRVGSFGK